MIEKNDHRRLERRGRGRRRFERDKALMAFEREQVLLRRIKNEAPLIELEKPFQRGWVRYFKLKAEAARRADAPRLRQVVSLIECRQRCRTGKWLAWSLKRRRMVSMRHSPRCFTPGELLSKKPPRELLKYFATEHHGWRVSEYEQLLWLYRRSHGGRLKFVYPHFLEAVVEPYMITHTRTHYPELERRIDEIERALESGGRERLNSLHGWRSYRYWEKRLGASYSEAVARQDMREQIRDALESPDPESTPPNITAIEAGKGAGDRAFFVSRPSVFTEAA